MSTARRRLRPRIRLGPFLEAGIGPGKRGDDQQEAEEREAERDPARHRGPGPDQDRAQALRDQALPGPAPRAGRQDPRHGHERRERGEKKELWLAKTHC